MSDKRSDFPCPYIIGSRSMSRKQAEQSRNITDTFAKKLDRRHAPVARAREARNEEYLAARRSDVKKKIRKPTE